VVERQEEVTPARDPTDHLLLELAQPGDQSRLEFVGRDRVDLVVDRVIELVVRPVVGISAPGLEVGVLEAHRRSREP
jgi:hypothetical protein